MGFRAPFLLVWVLIHAACASGPRIDTEREADIRYKLGLSHYSQGDFPRALVEFELADRLRPRHPETLQGLALVFAARQRYEKSLAHFDQALAARPDFSEAKVNKARLLIELNRPREALPLLKEASTDLRFQQTAEALSSLALAHHRLGDFQQSNAVLSQLFLTSRANCDQQVLWGRNLIELKRFSEAATALDQALATCEGSKMEEPHYLSGVAHFRQGRVTTAVARMQEVVRLYPQSPFAGRARDFLKSIRR